MISNGLVFDTTNGKQVATVGLDRPGSGDRYILDGPDDRLWAVAGSSTRWGQCTLFAFDPPNPVPGQGQLTNYWLGESGLFIRN